MKNYILLVSGVVLFLALTSFASTQEMPSSTRAAWIPDTEKLLVVNEQQRPLFWDIVAECPFYTGDRHEGAVIDVLVSDNGRLAVSSDITKRIKIWDVATGMEKHELVGFESPSSAISFTNGNKEMVLGDWSGVVKHWSLERFSEQNRFKAFDTPVFSLSTYYPKHLIAVGAGSGELLLWDSQFNIQVQKIFAHKSVVSAIKFAEEGETLVSASDDGSVLVWNYESDRKRYIRLEPGRVKIRSLDVSPDNQYILIGAETGVMYLIDLHLGTIVYRFNVSDDPLQLVKFTNEFEALLVDHNYRIWNFILATKRLKPVGEISREFIVPFSMDDRRGSDWLEKKSGMEFEWVSGGCFDIGCDARSDRYCSKDNMPAKNVCVNDYWMAKDEVSRDQWVKVMQQTLPFINIEMPLLQQDIEEKGEIAASGIPWHGAQDFTCRMNRLTRGNFRLPTEAEWEYACENAVETKKIKQLELDETWHKSTSVEQKLTQIRSAAQEDNEAIAPSWLGRVDIRGMHSGVSEWVLDIYSRFGYQYEMRYTPIFLKDDLYYFYNQETERVKRGGGWDRGVSVPECTARYFNTESDIHDLQTGLRLIIPIEPVGGLQSPTSIRFQANNWAN